MTTFTYIQDDIVLVWPRNWIGIVLAVDAPDKILVGYFDLHKPNLAGGFLIPHAHWVDCYKGEIGIVQAHVHYCFNDQLKLLYRQEKTG